MRVKAVEILNFRRLKATHVDFDKETTIFVGANNSGKTSAMAAMRCFLVAPTQLSLRDITIANWPKVDAVGIAWEADKNEPHILRDLLPSMDVWLDTPLSEIHHVAHMLPTLDWNGGLLGIRLQYQIRDVGKLKADYIMAKAAVTSTRGEHLEQVRGWPASLSEFLERRLRSYVELASFVLDPKLKAPPVHGVAKPQPLGEDAIALERNPFIGLIRVDEVAAQRDFADASGNPSEPSEFGSRRFKRRLSEQLRAYYDRHLDPEKIPSEEDLEALVAIQTAERNFDRRLEAGFSDAFRELESLGYPGMTNPKLKISTQLRPTDGLRHGSAVQYAVVDPTGDGKAVLTLPEDYSGLGYQNLIAMVFMLMSYRDEWMRVGKASVSADTEVSVAIPPLHLVLVEEPEAHLHAQVQQVFIKKAYQLLRQHADLDKGERYSTQLVVSTHSSHIAHEADFANLRYFRRRPATGRAESQTTTVANLSHVFGEGDETHRFVRRYLKATHCDLFFADGIIFVEGQAERILVPHFIRHHFDGLSRRYISILELGGSHAHSFKELVDVLGLPTLLIADLDATSKETVKTAAGGEAVRWKQAKPARGANQRTGNQVLKEWHPAKDQIDDLLSLEAASHASSGIDGYEFYVAYQKPLQVLGADGGTSEVIPRTFEDALIFENKEVLGDIAGSSTTKKVQNLVASGVSNDELAQELFELLKTAGKAEFAIDCLMLEDPKALRPPQYIRDGLSWFERAVSEDAPLNLGATVVAS
ncbi:MAG: AAA family ATPase [Labilithrix sp.]|nr:AAA family ATPase [Labilithrix sp.]MBX3216625.1 AAA family ATPase [Labilithrix sp.]